MNLTTKEITKEKVSIGLPIYNGSEFIHNCIEHLLDQTHKNFELIISDNGSTDSTPEICREYAKKDNRIRFIRHEKNSGQIWNFYFVLEQAKCKFFMWAAVDDYWSPKFLEINLDILLSNRDIVCSVSKMKPYGKVNEGSESLRLELRFVAFKNKLIKFFRPWGVYSISGTYEKKVRTLLKKSAYPLIYGIFRTDDLKRSMIEKEFVGPEVPILLNVLKYGDANVVDEVLMHKYDRGLSTGGMISLAKKLNGNLFGIIFPHYPLTLWCIKNLGVKIFFKNIDHFIKLNVGSEFLVVVDLIRALMQKMLGK